MHLRVYVGRPGVGAVVHAHPPTATGLGVAGEGLPEDVLPEVTVLLGSVPLVPYATSGTPMVEEGVAAILEGHEGALLANHGVVTRGPDLHLAQARMESLEHAARILLSARRAGRVNHLTPVQANALGRPRGISGHEQAEA